MSRTQIQIIGIVAIFIMIGITPMVGCYNNDQVTALRHANDSLANLTSKKEKHRNQWALQKLLMGTDQHQEWDSTIRDGDTYALRIISTKGNDSFFYKVTESADHPTGFKGIKQQNNHIYIFGIIWPDSEFRDTVINYSFTTVNWLDARNKDFRDTVVIHAKMAFSNLIRFHPNWLFDDN